jgi:phosphoglycolate phosphatase
MKRRHELIIFDWDGTLMDSVARIERCFSAALDEVGAASVSTEAIRHIIGLGLDEAISVLLPSADILTHQKVKERYRQHFLHIDQTAMELFPGVHAGLEALVSQGYLLAVATGKARRGLERVLRATDTAHFFHATRCADETFSKPHPQMLEDILVQTGMQADQSLMVGDTTYDMQMARDARIDGLAVTYGVHDRAQLIAHGPVACLDSFAEVYAWLQQNNGQSSVVATS